MLKFENLHNTTYKPLSKHITKNIDTHIFFLCTSYKKELVHICKLFDIKSLPVQLFKDFHGLQNEMVTHYLENTKLIFIGYGKEKECNHDLLYEIGLSLGKKISNANEVGQNMIIHLLKEQNDLYIHHLVSGIILGNYKFDLLKSKDSKDRKKVKKNNIYFYHPKKSVFKSIQNYITLSTIHNEVRNYMNLPSNLLRIVDYIKYMKLFLPKNISLKIINKKMLQKLGMNLILAVNQGANQDCALVLLEYKGTKSEGKKDKPICFIGKGVMFDSGGYDIKTRTMEEMKFDMTASAIMYGLMKAHSLLKSSGHYIALLPLVENMISENAIRPSDVVISHSGKSVEIVNTDAEGRLIIADCLSYCKKYNPRLIVDMGTLSGETAHIFGNKSSVIMGNNFKINREIMEVGKKYHEHIWELPMWDIYLDELKSEIADIRNVSKSGKSGAITVGSFLSQFVPKNKDGKTVDWVHLDIAGTEVASQSPYYNDGAKIEILKTLYFYTK